MIYQLHELHHASLIPARLWAGATTAICGSPLNPFSHNVMNRMMVASADVLLRMTHRYPKPEFGLTETTVEGRAVKVWEERVVDKPFCTLLRFRRDTDVRQPT